MKATKAYIAGLGTTAVLIGSFLLLLAVGSALVAFDGWPGAAADDGLDRVVVERDSTRTAPARAKRATGMRARAAGRARDRRGAEPAARSHRGDLRRRPAGAAGGLGDGDAPQGGAGAPPSPASDTSATGGGGGDGRGGGGLPQLPVSAPDVANTVSGATGGGGDAVQGATGAAGQALGGVSPGAGEAVTGTGETVGGVVDSAGQQAGGVVGGAGETVDGVLP
jgi:hypothetical protein